MKDIASTKAQNTQVTIFAVQPHDPHAVMNFMVQERIPFKVALGSYKGQQETSFIVQSEEFEKIIKAGYVEKQESIMVVSPKSANESEARLVFLNSDTEDLILGKFVPTDRETAMTKDGYTYDPLSDAFFVIEEFNTEI